MANESKTEIKRRANVKPENAVANEVNIERVQELIKEQGWSMKSLTEFLGSGIGGLSSHGNSECGSYSPIYYLKTHYTIDQKILNNLAFCLNVTIEYLTGKSNDEFKEFEGTIHSDFTHCYVISKEITNAFDGIFIKRYGIPMRIVNWLKSDDRLVTENIARKAVAWYLHPVAKGRYAISIDSDDVTKVMSKYTRKIELDKSNKNSRTITENSKIVYRINTLIKDIKVSTSVILGLSCIDEDKCNYEGLNTASGLRKYLSTEWSYENDPEFINNIAWALNVDVDFLLCKHDDYSLKFQGARTVGKFNDYLVDLSTDVNHRNHIEFINCSANRHCPGYLENWLYNGKRRVNKTLAENIIKSVMGDKWYKHNYIKLNKLPDWIVHLDSNDADIYTTEPPIEDKPKIEFEPTTTPIKYSDTLADIVNKHLPKLTTEELTKLHYIIEGSYGGMPISDIPAANDVIIHAEDYSEEDIIAMQNALETVHPVKVNDGSIDNVIDCLDSLTTAELNKVIERSSEIIGKDLCNKFEEKRYVEAAEGLADSINIEMAEAFYRTISTKFNFANCYDDFAVRLCKAIMYNIGSKQYPVYPLNVENEPNNLKYVLEDDNCYFIQAGTIKQMKSAYDTANKMNDIKLTTPEIVKDLMNYGVASATPDYSSVAEKEVFNKKFVILSKEAINNILEASKSCKNPKFQDITDASESETVSTTHEEITVDDIIDSIGKMSNEDRTSILNAMSKAMPIKTLTIADVINSISKFDTIECDQIKDAIDIVHPTDKNSAVIDICSAILWATTGDDGYSVQPIIGTRSQDPKIILESEKSYFVQLPSIKTMVDKYYASIGKTETFKLNTHGIGKTLIAFGIVDCTDSEGGTKTKRVLGHGNTRYLELNKNTLIGIASGDFNTKVEHDEPVIPGNTHRVSSDIDIDKFISIYLPALPDDKVQMVRNTLNIIDPPTPVTVPITLSSIRKEYIPNADLNDIIELYVAVNSALPSKYKSNGTYLPVEINEMIKKLCNDEIEITTYNDSKEYSAYKHNSSVSLKHVINDMLRLTQSSFEVMRKAVISGSTPSEVNNAVIAIRNDLKPIPEPTEETEHESAPTEHSKLEDCTVKNEIIEVFRSCIGHDETNVQTLANDWLAKHSGYGVKLIDHTIMPSIEHYGSTDQVMTIVFSK